MFSQNNENARHYKKLLRIEKNYHLMITNKLEHDQKDIYGSKKFSIFILFLNYKFLLKYLVFLKNISSKLTLTGSLAFKK